MTKTYKGRLASPLPQPDFLTSEDYEADVDAYHKEVADRIDLLFKHYGIAKKNRDAWCELALALAADHVPGFKSQKPRKDPDRNVRILFRMIYLCGFRGLSEKQAAQVISELSPELGKPEAIRSAFREMEFHPSYSQILKLFHRIEQGVGSEVFRLALRAGIGDVVDDLDRAKPLKRGRPKKK